MINDEYDTMIEAFNENGLLVENMYLKYNKEHPITYAELNPDNGYFEKALTHRDDIASCQSLDYMFAVKINHNYYYNQDNKADATANGAILERREADIVQTNINTNNNSNKNEAIITLNVDNKAESSHKEIEDNDTKEKTSNSIKTKIKSLDLADVNDKNKGLYVIPESLRVIKHLISEMNFEEHMRAYTQLSDHYGLSCLLKLNDSSIVKDAILVVKDNNDDEVLEVIEDVNKLKIDDNKETLSPQDRCNRVKQYDEENSLLFKV